MDIEKFFIAMTCVDANRVTFATFMVIEEVKNWRRFVKQQFVDKGI